MKRICLVGNKIDNEKQEEIVKDFAQKNGLDLLDIVPFDKKIVEAEVEAQTPLRNEDSEALQAIEKLCERLAARNCYELGKR